MNAAARLVVCLAAAAVLPAFAAGSGLIVPADALDSTRWEARIEIDAGNVVGRSLTSPWLLGPTPLTGRLLGDYRIDALRFGQGAGGLKLTSGVLVNLRGLVAGGAIVANPEASSLAQPYAGIGYSGASARGEWGFSAELGLTAQNPGAAVQFGRLFNGVSFGDTVRDLRLQPMIRLGMNVAF